jgi:hypothetical protein
MKKISLVFLLSVLLCSCATIFSGRNDKVKVTEGNPIAAKVYYNGSYVGNAPCEVKVPKADLRNRTAVITIKAEGYEDQEIILTRKLKVGALVGDILTGVVWIVVDVLDSAIYKSSKDKVHYDLQKKSWADEKHRLHINATLLRKQ